jgi:selenocysteine insertion sequence-binding protein 2
MQETNHLSCVLSLVPKDQFHKMVELTMVARQAYKTMLENMQQDLAGGAGPQIPPSPPTQDPSCSSVDDPPASTGKEPHYSECSVKGLVLG